jgi:hypothetical protein
MGGGAGAGGMGMGMSSMGGRAGVMASMGMVGSTEHAWPLSHNVSREHVDVDSVYTLRLATDLAGELFEVQDTPERHKFWDRLKRLVLVAKEAPREGHRIMEQYPEKK